MYSFADINKASNAYLKRLKELELEDSCGGQCGFKVVGRNNIQKIGQRFSYPMDFQTKCPIMYDTVVIRSNDGKHYAYKLHYNRHRGATEVLKPHLFWGGRHNPIANSDNDVANGLFRGCGYRVRNIVHRFGMADTFLRGRLVLKHSAPYAKTHGLPQCRKTWVRCDLSEGTDSEGKGSWVAPSANANLYHYLSGFDENRVANKCSESGASYVVKTRMLDKAERDRLRIFPSKQDAASRSYANVLADKSRSQLGQSYWMYQDAAIKYGHNNNFLSTSKPFFSADTSHGSDFIRVHRRMSEKFENVKVQQCYDPVPPPANP